MSWVIYKLSKALRSLGLAVIVFWLAASYQFYTEAISSSFFSIALASVLVIHFRLRCSWFDALLICLLSGLFAALDFYLLHFKYVPVAWISFAGLSSLAVLGVRAIW
jgi:hypothetical protein